jgi:hypothetical protein
MGGLSSIHPLTTDFHEYFIMSFDIFARWGNEVVVREPRDLVRFLFHGMMHRTDTMRDGMRRR